jgi:hypothetical protein
MVLVKTPWARPSSFTVTSPIVLYFSRSTWAVNVGLLPPPLLAFLYLWETADFPRLCESNLKYFLALKCSQKAAGRRHVACVGGTWHAYCMTSSGQ